MAILNPSDLTFNGEEIRSIREAILEQVFIKPAVTDFHTIYEDIVTKKQIAFLGRLGKITRTDLGCGSTPLSAGITNSEKFWEPVRFEIWLSECYTNLESTFFVWAKQRGINEPDLTGTDFAAFLVERMSDAMFEDTLRIAWLGDTSAESVDATPSGILSAGVNPLDYNQLDGFWKQLFAIGTANSSIVTSISENALGTKALQDNLAADRAFLVFQGLMTKADFRLRGATDKIILATQSLVDNYATYLETQGNDASFIRIEQGFTTLRYRNLEIVGVDLWDRYIRADFDNGTTYDVPHRAVMTTKANIALGVDASSALGDIDQWFERKDKTTNFRGGYKMDAKVLEDYMVSLAY
jgi:hypothetical protein